MESERKSNSCKAPSVNRSVGSPHGQSGLGSALSAADALFRHLMLARGIVCGAAVTDAWEKTKKSRATNVPGKFIREASRLGDVGPLAGPWVCRAGSPTKTEKTVREKTLYRVRCLPLRFEKQDSVFDRKDHCQIALSAMQNLHKCRRLRYTRLNY